eukprot:g3858.t1
MYMSKKRCERYHQYFIALIFLSCLYFSSSAMILSKDGKASCPDGTLKYSYKADSMSSKKRIRSLEATIEVFCRCSDNSSSLYMDAHVSNVSIKSFSHQNDQSVLQKRKDKSLAREFDGWTSFVQKSNGEVDLTFFTEENSSQAALEFRSTLIEQSFSIAYGLKSGEGLVRRNNSSMSRFSSTLGTSRSRGAVLQTRTTTWKDGKNNAGVKVQPQDDRSRPEVDVSRTVRSTIEFPPTKNTRMPIAVHTVEKVSVNPNFSIQVLQNKKQNVKTGAGSSIEITTISSLSLQNQNTVQFSDTSVSSDAKIFCQLEFTDSSSSSLVETSSNVERNLLNRKHLHRHKARKARIKDICNPPNLYSKLHERKSKKGKNFTSWKPEEIRECLRKPFDKTMSDEGHVRSYDCKRYLKQRELLCRNLSEFGCVSYKTKIKMELDHFEVDESEENEYDKMPRCGDACTAAYEVAKETSSENDFLQSQCNDVPYCMYQISPSPSCIDVCNEENFKEKNDEASCVALGSVNSGDSTRKQGPFSCKWVPGGSFPWSANGFCQAVFTNIEPTTIWMQLLAKMKTFFAMAVTRVKSLAGFQESVLVSKEAAERADSQRGNSEGIAIEKNFLIQLADTIIDKILNFDARGILHFLDNGLGLCEKLIAGEMQVTGSRYIVRFDRSGRFAPVFREFKPLIVKTQELVKSISDSIAELRAMILFPLAGSGSASGEIEFNEKITNKCADAIDYAYFKDSNRCSQIEKKWRESWFTLQNECKKENGCLYDKESETCIVDLVQFRPGNELLSGAPTCALLLQEDRDVLKRRARFEMTLSHHNRFRSNLNTMYTYDSMPSMKCFRQDDTDIEVNNVDKTQCLQEGECLDALSIPRVIEEVDQSEFDEIMNDSKVKKRKEKEGVCIYRDLGFKVNEDDKRLCHGIRDKKKCEEVSGSKPSICKFLRKIIIPKGSSHSGACEAQGFRWKNRNIWIQRKTKTSKVLPCLSIREDTSMPLLNEGLGLIGKLFRFPGRKNIFSFCNPKKIDNNKCTILGTMEAFKGKNGGSCVITSSLQAFRRKRPKLPSSTEDFGLLEESHPFAVGRGKIGKYACFNACSGNKMCLSAAFDDETGSCYLDTEDVAVLYSTTTDRKVKDSITYSIKGQWSYASCPSSESALNATSRIRRACNDSNECFSERYKCLQHCEALRPSSEQYIDPVLLRGKLIVIEENRIQGRKDCGLDEIRKNMERSGALGVIIEVENREQSRSRANSLTTVTVKTEIKINLPNSTFFALDEAKEQEIRKVICDNIRDYKSLHISHPCVVKFKSKNSMNILGQKQMILYTVSTSMDESEIDSLHELARVEMEKFLDQLTKNCKEGSSDAKCLVAGSIVETSNIIESTLSNMSERETNDKIVKALLKYEDDFSVKNYQNSKLPLCFAASNDLEEFEKDGHPLVHIDGHRTKNLQDCFDKCLLRQKAMKVLHPTHSLFNILGIISGLVTKTVETITQFNDALIPIGESLMDSIFENTEAFELFSATWHKTLGNPKTLSVTASATASVAFDPDPQGILKRQKEKRNELVEGKMKKLDQYVYDNQKACSVWENNDDIADSDVKKREESLKRKEKEFKKALPISLDEKEIPRLERKDPKELLKNSQTNAHFDLSLDVSGLGLVKRALSVNWNPHLNFKTGFQVPLPRLEVFGARLSVSSAPEILLRQISLQVGAKLALAILKHTNLSNIITRQLLQILTNSETKYFEWIKNTMNGGISEISEPIHLLLHHTGRSVEGSQSSDLIYTSNLFNDQNINDSIGKLGTENFVENNQLPPALSLGQSFHNQCHCHKSFLFSIISLRTY